MDRWRLSHLALWAGDLERMRAFYVSALGASSGPLYENPRTGFRSYFVTFSDGVGIELMSRAVRAEAGPSGGERGYAHVAISVGTRAAVDETVERLRTLGVTILGEARTTGDGSYEAVVADPEGNPIEILEDPDAGHTAKAVVTAAEAGGHTIRIALANLRFPKTPDESVSLATEAIEQAARDRAGIICFPECYVPGYRGLGRSAPPPDPEFLERAWSTIAESAARACITVVLGTERVVDRALLASVLVINADGTRAGFQDKVQIDPSEEGLYTPGSGRRVFQSGPLTFGVAICHEGWRYPETVRWAARRGAHVVFHPHLHEAEPGFYEPTTFADPANSFHEKAALCRAAENTCYFATVNYASAGSPTTSAVASPDGTVLGYQPYGREGVFMVDIDLSAATGLLAGRYKPVS